MYKLSISAAALVGFVQLISATGAGACPPCPAGAKYCISPNTPNSHCEAVLPDLKSLQSAIKVTVEGQTFVLGPESTVTITSPN
jgi:hypothetical protein